MTASMEGISLAEEKYYEGYDEGYERGYDEGYDEGHYDGANSRPDLNPELEDLKDRIMETEVYFLQLYEKIQTKQYQACWLELLEQCQKETGRIITEGWEAKIGDVKKHT